jgi:hypothetical protein
LAVGRQTLDLVYELQGFERWLRKSDTAQQPYPPLTTAREMHNRAPQFHENSPQTDGGTYKADEHVLVCDKILDL